jgi:hypothetical protein
LFLRSILANNNHQISHGVPDVANQLNRERTDAPQWAGKWCATPFTQSAWDALTFANGWVEFNAQAAVGPPFQI